MIDPPAADRDYWRAVLVHGFTTWGDSSMGTGRPGGQVVTTETHIEVIQHLAYAAMAGAPLATAADQWEAMFPGTVRLDDFVTRVDARRRGPDGRPLAKR